ncbi:DUF6197 family protein [Actinomadura rugatobispora]|uniref:Uncharacterized protein n=1 Tax=Actinomadura rugatobispora TaxID=1994 RepID=A0ABW0ZPR7_9ACTN|nr:hypothetical protein GCM10010200_035830 [Actinomadura rugatobispora]
MNTAIAAQLNAAADHITEHGWTTGDWHEPTIDHANPGHYLPINQSRLCALAAIKIACGQDADDAELTPATRAAARAFADHLGLNVPADHDDEDGALTEAIGGWNDRDGQTREQVIAALRAAAGALTAGSPA